MTRTDVVICGAGIAGVALACQLSRQPGMGKVLLVDERPPLTLTSDKSTEAYRDWWPGPDRAMRQLMGRSIDLLEELALESDNRFLLNRRGYLYVTASPERAAEMERQAGEYASEVRRHHPGDDQYQAAVAEGFAGEPDGVDLLWGTETIQRHFPYLSPRAIAAMHTRRCGWFSGQQLGMYLLEQGRAQGVQLLQGRVSGVRQDGGRVNGVCVDTAGTSQEIPTGVFVNAAGPLVGQVGKMLGLELPIFSERHLKASFNDTLGLVPREAPLLIWDDPQQLSWTAEEREWLAESEETAWLLEQLPPGAHMRPEGGGNSQAILLLWSYHTGPTQVALPLPPDPDFPEVVMRGMTSMIPGLAAYLDPLPRPWVDGGYYTKTRENRMLACPLPVEGAFLLGALSGYGLMASLAAAELLAAHISGGVLPAYAPAFDLRRYDDPAYMRQIESWGGSLQL